MRSIVLFLCAVASVAAAQSQPFDETGIRSEAGGPSRVGGVLAFDMAIADAFRDVAVATPLHKFQIVRTFSSVEVPAWEGSAWFSGPSSRWWSNLSTYAFIERRSAKSLNGELVVEPSKRVVVRDFDGASTSSADFVDLPMAVVLPSTGEARLRLDGDRITLIRPGDGVYVYEDTGIQVPLNPMAGQVSKQFFRLRSISPEANIGHEDCVVSYGLLDTQGHAALGKASGVSCTGGVRFDILWSPTLDRVEKVVLSAPNVTPRDVVDYVFDSSGQLTLAVFDDGVVERYEYDSGLRVRRSMLNAQGGNTGYWTVSDKIAEIRQECAAGQWWPTSVYGSELTPGDRFDYVRLWPQPLACSSNLQLRQTSSRSNGSELRTTAFVSPFTATGGSVHDYSTHEKKQLTTRIDVACVKNGSACSSMKNTTESWVVDVLNPRLSTQEHIDARGVVESIGVSGQSVVLSGGAELYFNQLDTVSRGNGNSESSFEWGYFDGRGAREPVLLSETRESGINKGEKVRFVRRYDSSTKSLTATFTEGYTATVNGGVELRTVGTFFLSKTRCDGAGTSDQFSRTVEVHGPCFVQSIDSTDCDLQDSFPGEPVRITQFEYYPTEVGSPNSGRLRAKRVYSRTEGQVCERDDALETIFEAYDAAGHVLREVDPSGVVTTRTFLGDKLLSETVAGQTTSYWYSPAQGGRLSGVGHPDGSWDVYCYRLGSDEASCTQGVPVPELQWSARIAGVGPGVVLPDGSFSNGGWSIVEKTSFEYEAGVGVTQPGGGRLVSKRVVKGLLRRNQAFLYDDMGRQNLTFVPNAGGGVSYGVPQLLDEVGNVAAMGRSSQAPVLECGGWPNVSSSCARMTYDDLNQLRKTEKSVSLPQSTNLLFEYGYDPRGRLNAVAVNQEELVSYDSDDFGNAVTIRGHWGGPVWQEFDAAGLLRVRRNSSQVQAGTSVQYSYDAAGRPVRAESGTQLLWAVGYDGKTQNWQNCPDSRLSPVGLVQWRDDSFGRTWYEYDSARRIVALRRVRSSAPVRCSDLAHESSGVTPDSKFDYLPDGRLAQMKYPHGLRVAYDWGTNGRQDEVTQVRHDDNGGGWKVVASDIVYDIGGSVRGYKMGESGSAVAEYSLSRRGSSPGSLLQSCSPMQDVPTDGSGRSDALEVRRIGEAGAENVFSRRYAWDADRLSSQSTCVLDDSEPVREGFLYDKLSQLTQAKRADGEFLRLGGPFRESLQFDYQRGSDRTQATDSSDYLSSSFDNSRRLKVVTDESMFRQLELEHDTDGRVTRVSDRKLVPGGSILSREIRLTPDNGLGSVYQSVGLAYGGGLATYQYFYDFEGRRRLKVNPAGITDEYFYDRNQMIEDRGSFSVGGDDGKVIDQYIYLAGMPIAVLRRPLGDNGAEWIAEGYQLKRNDIPMLSGIYYVVSDFISKPVAMLDGVGRLAGLMEYAPFGSVNRVRIGVDARQGYSPYPSGAYGANEDRVLGQVIQPPRTAKQSVRARVRFAVVNSLSGDDLRIEDHATGSLLAKVGGVKEGFFDSAWFPVGPEGLDLRWSTNSVQPKLFTGVSIDSFEYERTEVGVALAAKVPVRFPGQYFDEETELHENWNRLYSPLIGQYLSPDPLLGSPSYVEGEAQAGAGVSVYAYAANNPLVYADSTGLSVAIDATDTELWAQAWRELVAAMNDPVVGKDVTAMVMDPNFTGYIWPGEIPTNGAGGLTQPIEGSLDNDMQVPLPLKGDRNLDGLPMTFKSNFWHELGHMVFNWKFENKNFEWVNGNAKARSLWMIKASNAEALRYERRVPGYESRISH
jgi:RHS repeat-associated protein